MTSSVPTSPARMMMPQSWDLSGAPDQDKADDAAHDRVSSQRIIPASTLKRSRNASTIAASPKCAQHQDHDVDDPFREAGDEETR